MPEEEYKSLNEVLDFDEFFVLCMEKKKKGKQILSALERLQYCLNTVTVPSGMVLGCAGVDLPLGSGDELLLGWTEQPHWGQAAELWPRARPGRLSPRSPVIPTATSQTGSQGIKKMETEGAKRKDATRSPGWGVSAALAVRGG